MGIVFLVAVGSVLGWLTSIMMQIENDQKNILNVSSGIVGALLTGLVISPLLGRGNLAAGTYSVGTLLLSVLGAALLIALTNLLRQERLR